MVTERPEGRGVGDLHPAAAQPHPAAVLELAEDLAHHHPRGAEVAHDLLVAQGDDAAEPFIVGNGRSPALTLNQEVLNPSNRRWGTTETEQELLETA